MKNILLSFFLIIRKTDLAPFLMFEAVVGASLGRSLLLSLDNFYPPLGGGLVVDEQIHFITEKNSVK